MSRFYFSLWLRWATRLTLCSIAFASILSIFVTIFIYISQGMPTHSSEVYAALAQVFVFWFVVLWNFTLLIALFRSLKYIFNSCHSGYKLQLLSCSKEGESEVIDFIGYGDLLKVWRKWFMLIIWLVGAQMIFALILTKLFSSYDSIFEWFNIYILYAFILVGGYFSFILLISRCKKVKIVKC
ncbi:MAG: hypothetical protein ABFQ64_09035 [Campylobacterota bacterium]